MKWNHRIIRIVEMAGGSNDAKAGSRQRQKQGVTECSRHLKLNTCSAAVIRIFEKDVWDC